MTSKTRSIRVTGLTVLALLGSFTCAHVDGLVPGGAPVQAVAGDTPWPAPEGNTLAGAQLGDTPWPAPEGNTLAGAQLEDTPWPAGS